MGWGFDPAYSGPMTDLDGRIEFVRSFYDREYADLSPDVVVCRHVIEHVPEPARLLSEIRQASTGARVFIETPDVEWILRNEVIWDLFYEHCSYFSSYSFATAFQRAGFKDVKSTRIFGDQYLWVEASGTPEKGEKTTCDPGNIAKIVENYTQRERKILVLWNQTIAELRKRGPIALWGAGAKGVTFASLFDPQAELITCVADLNPAKQNRFIGGSGHPIVSPSALSTLGIKHVVLMNPNYLGEVRQLLAREKIVMNVVVKPELSAMA